MYLRSVLVISGIFCLLSCEKRASFNPYFQNSSLSDIHGIPNDSLQSYYPDSVKTDSGFVATKLDSFQNAHYSECLRAFNEPVLYNYYLDTNVYRFLWLPSFDEPVVISLKKKNEKVWLVVKRLNKYPEFVKYENAKFSIPIVINDSSVLDTAFLPENETEFERKLKEELKIDLNKKVTLTIDDWNNFEGLLSKASFWTGSFSGEYSTAIDGSEWIIEAHLESKYWFAHRHSPKGEFKNAGEFLINKSGLNLRVY